MPRWPAWPQLQGYMLSRCFSLAVRQASPVPGRVSCEKPGGRAPALPFGAAWPGHTPESDGPPSRHLSGTWDPSRAVPLGIPGILGRGSVGGGALASGGLVLEWALSTTGPETLFSRSFINWPLCTVPATPQPPETSGDPILAPESHTQPPSVACGPQRGAPDTSSQGKLGRTELRVGTTPAPCRGHVCHGRGHPS